MADDHFERDGASGWRFDEWEAFMRSICSHVPDFHIGKEERKSFTGWAQLVSLFGLVALDQWSSEVQCEQTSRKVRLGTGDYAVSLQLAGSTVALQNDRVIKAVPGDLFLLDTAGPGRRVDNGRCFSFILPRQSAVSYLGYEPQGALLSRGTIAGRLLFQLATEIAKREQSALTLGDTYMQMAVYDLLCAVFAGPDNDLQSGSSHTEKLFEQVCSIIRDSITDPDLTPSKVAAEAGISLRYLQKLFTPRGTTCTHFIHSLRLDHARRLLHRRTTFRGKQSLNEIAFAAGFRDYTFFSRKFRERFGCVPSVYSGND
jgi:AraC-like DNA-binding protein